MCNKQKPFHKYNGRIGKNFTFFTLIAILLITGFQISCQSSSVPINNVQLSISDLEGLTEAVIARDTGALLNRSNPHIGLMALESLHAANTLTGLIRDEGISADL